MAFSLFNRSRTRITTILSIPHIGITYTRRQFDSPPASKGPLITATDSTGGNMTFVAMRAEYIGKRKAEASYIKIAITA